ncbi:hypothetical protein BDK51DRAFT_42976 [Blyttiomyces helicus]|uniref:Uncharacterized protein n=1 Tax=Blyttiomyces helicus TaxID=388810 RepID=A0A4P9WHZ1_9FUNG|nr:hypothetical protein BDK51DRAFT_42976 [Blyttiomyces helicus]|eukprot:RKO90166.1 hypothetical protein BDK51DRAFT_42976 [Blyttiomyces helicus]
MGRGPSDPSWNWLLPGRSLVPKWEPRNKQYRYGVPELFSRSDRGTAATGCCVDHHRRLKRFASVIAGRGDNANIDCGCRRPGDRASYDKADSSIALRVRMCKFPPPRPCLPSTIMKSCSHFSSSRDENPFIRFFSNVNNSINKSLHMAVEALNVRILDVTGSDVTGSNMSFFASANVTMDLFDSKNDFELVQEAAALIKADGTYNGVIGEYDSGQ